MFGHMPELIIILVLALIVFGPEKLPEVASSVGKAMREVRTALDTAMHPEDQEVPEDFSTYYYESLARAGEDGPEEAPESEDEEPWHYSIEGSEQEGDEEHEPIPIRADHPEVPSSDSSTDEMVPVEYGSTADAPASDQTGENKGTDRPLGA